MTGHVVTHLTQKTTVEIVDLDEVASSEEVQAALLKAIHGDVAPPPDEISVKVTGIWRTTGGRQMATAEVPVAAAGSFKHIRVGWLWCRVRRRRPKPIRCFRVGRMSMASDIRPANVPALTWGKHATSVETPAIWLESAPSGEAA